MAGIGAVLAACVLWAAACSGGMQDDPDGSGGSSGSGGSADGSGGAISGAGGTGGQAPGTGGFDGTGGDGASAGLGGGISSMGGSSSGFGGSGSANEGWDEVRCFHFGEAETGAICFGRLGNLWTAVFPMCVIESQTRYPMDLNAQCWGEDDPTGWDETWCTGENECNARRGRWHMAVDVGCNLPSEAPVDTTPSEARCDGPAEAPTGWENVQCFPSDSGGFVKCFGSLGLYYPTWGLFPTCYLDANYANSPDFSEVPADSEMFCQ